MAEIQTTVTFLEMTAEPLLHVAPPGHHKIMLMRAEKPTVAFYRFLYDAVGRNFHWIDRKKLDDAALVAIIHDANVEVWILYAGSQPAGFFEVDGREAPGEVELMYLGLLPEFHGLGLGKWLLGEAIRACWARKPQRVVVETCTLDGPAALPLYQKLGFTPYAREDKTLEISG